jgi:hypothetical protein
MRTTRGHYRAVRRHLSYNLRATINGTASHTVVAMLVHFNVLGYTQLGNTDTLVSQTVSRGWGNFELDPKTPAITHYLLVLEHKRNGRDLEAEPCSGETISLWPLQLQQYFRCAAAPTRKNLATPVHDADIVGFFVRHQRTLGSGGKNVI